MNTSQQFIVSSFYLDVSIKIFEFRDKSVLLVFFRYEVILYTTKYTTSCNNYNVNMLFSIAVYMIQHTPLKSK